MMHVGKFAVDVAFDNIGEQTLKNIPNRCAHGTGLPARPLLRSDQVRLRYKFKIWRYPTNFASSVLPFDNMSAEAGQDYLADEIVEAITAALSCIPFLLRYRT